MIYLDAAKLVILSQPKTGTVALARALASHASMTFTNPPRMKHIGYAAFQKHVAPMMADVAGVAREAYEVVTVMREPLDWMGSFYRYRTRDQLKDENDPRAQFFTGNVTFEAFIRQVCGPEQDKPPHARVGSPCRVALAADRTVGVDRLYPYEDLSGLYQRIEEARGAPFETLRHNVSPVLPLELSEEARALFCQTFAFERDLHASLRSDGQVEARFRTKRLEP